jgi:thiosulfate dehydrogenase
MAHSDRRRTVQFRGGRCLVTAAALLLGISGAQAFTPPPESAIPAGPFGDAVRRGEAIFTDTQKNARAFVGNDLNCSNCHLDRGRQAGAVPMWGAWPLYPQFRAKNGKVNTMALRIQECFRYSMNGTMPPSDSQLITDLQSYFSWLAKGAPAGETLPGQGLPALAAPHPAPDPRRGGMAYGQHCAACHGADGNGNREAAMPPLWGPRSFNKGAGMYRVETAARFIHANMPLGQGGSLSPQQAYDIAAFIESKPRPADPRLPAGK